MSFVQTFARLAVKENARVANETAYQLVHLRFFESTFMSTAILLAAFKATRTADGLVKKLAEVDGTIFSAQHPFRYTAATHFVTLVRSSIRGFGKLSTRFAVT